jgi:hypothetical protein
MEYKNKYYKYKAKYLQLSNKNNLTNLTGGNKNLIIHISGCQGSGKTILGVKLKKKFGNSIYLEDLDNLNANFTNQNQNKNPITNFQEYLNNYIQTNNDKPLILTGLTANKCVGLMDNKDNTFYKIDTKYKFFIDLDDETLLKQRFLRQVSKLYERKEDFFELWLQDEKNIHHSSGVS